MISGMACSGREREGLKDMSPWRSGDSYRTRELLAFVVLGGSFC